MNARTTDEAETVTAEHAPVAGRKVTVVGAARSGLGAARLLGANGASVFVTDLQPAGRLTESLIELKKLGIPFEAGGHTERAYDADLMVISPGVPSDAGIIREAALKGIRVVSEIEMASWFCAAKIAAVTGTNGKTTTVTLLGRLLEEGGVSSAVAGNIGTAFSAVAPDLGRDAVAALEVSSFQLDHVESFRPAVSVLLNITPDHLDRYGGSFDRYAKSKCRIFKNQGPGDALIYNTDDHQARTRVERLAPEGVRMLPFGLDEVQGDGAFRRSGRLVVRQDGVETDVIGTEEIGIPGVHNLYNAMAAVMAAFSFGVTPESAAATLKAFRGVEHRLEFVRELAGVKYINDSKATNVDSVWYALQSYAAPVVLILGGRDKGNDYSKLSALVQTSVNSIVAIGESADKVVRFFSGMVPVEKAASMDEAVTKAASAAPPGGVVLLSPACASFDWFDNYEHRGRTFKEAVWRLQ